MKVKLTINNKEFEVEISEEELKKFEEKSAKKTGYERVRNDDHFYWIDGLGEVCVAEDIGAGCDNERYDNANYYSDKTVAENNARADKLMHQLRRFSAEHRQDAIDWDKSARDKYYIFFNHNINKPLIENNQFIHTYGTIYFNSYATAELAIDTYRDELTWYFTEYKDSL